MQIGGRSENVIHRKRASTTIDWKTCAKINYLISQRVTVYIKINNIHGQRSKNNWQCEAVQSSVQTLASN